jgi:hypothetical protein
MLEWQSLLTRSESTPSIPMRMVPYELAGSG